MPVEPSIFNGMLHCKCGINGYLIKGMLLGFFAKLASLSPIEGVDEWADLRLNLACQTHF